MPKSKQKSGTAKAVVTNSRRSGRKVNRPSKLQTDEQNKNLDESESPSTNDIELSDNIDLAENIRFRSAASGNNPVAVNNDDGQIPSCSYNVSQPSRAEFDILKKSMDEMKNLIVHLSNGSNKESTNNSDSPRVNQGINVDKDNAPVVNTGNIDLSEVTFQVEDSLNQHVEMLLPTENNFPRQSGEYTDIGRPIDLKVSDKVRKQIWNHEYVDLYSLMDPNAEIPDYLRFVNEGGSAYKLAPQKNQKRITSLGQWCDGFLIYLTVYCRKYPEQISHLTAYIHLIKTLCSKRGDYVFYDEEFRHMRARNGGGSWELHNNLWMEARDVRGNLNKNSHQRGNNSNFRGLSSQTNDSKGKSQHPSGTCYRYHSSGKCNNSKCSFKHTCYLCSNGQTYPVFLCPKHGFPTNNTGRFTGNTGANATQSSNSGKSS